MWPEDIAALGMVKPASRPQGEAFCLAKITDCIARWINQTHLWPKRSPQAIIARLLQNECERMVLSAPETPIQRRLAAIVAADVAGYSRLMGANEEGTMRLLSARREFMDAQIARHGGRIANTAGDSVLAEFPSVFKALECSLAVQRGHASENAPLPRDERISFRIGIHLGDVMVKSGDLFGDGVNMAARLQELAEPGGIALSAKVRDEVAGKIAVQMDDAGEHVLRNIARPVHVWRVRFEKAVRDAAAPQLPQPAKAPSRKFDWRAKAAAGLALLVLVVAAPFAYIWASRSGVTAFYLTPFVAASDAGMAKPLADRLTARLATGLGTVPYIRVVVPTAQGGAGSGSVAKYTISGRVDAGNVTTRVEAQITEIATGQIIATTGFDAPQREMSEMQDEILDFVANELSIEINKLRYPFPIDTPEKQKARSLAQEARLRVDLRTKPQRAIELFDQATALSPNDVDIAGWRANNLVAIGSIQPTGSAERKAHLDAARAILTRHKANIQFHRLLSYAQCQMLNYSGELQAALAACGETRRLLPWSARVEKEIGSVQMKLGLLEQSLASFTQADRLERKLPIRWAWKVQAGLACLLLNRNQEAVSWLAQAAALRMDLAGIQALFAVALKRTDDSERLRQQIGVLDGMARDRGSEVKAAIQKYYAATEFSNATLQPRLASIAREFDGIMIGR
jgi:class 3 adenylate cyclase/tetratricopeptide (TPR) repeat protein